ncbi:MAG: MoaD/ThiS family protein [Pseudomonadota bacterium]
MRGHREPSRSQDVIAAVKITLKLYATLGDLLPPHAKNNAAEIEVDEDVTLNEIIQRFQIPPELAHLVLVNGHFACEADRNHPMLKPDDVLAIWPPVAGG